MEMAIWNDETSLHIVPASVSFSTFPQYRQAAQDVASYIKSLTLTEDNVKDVKLTLADARKVTDALNRRRIDIKKEILAEYTEFESQIKELTGIIDEADAELRKKLKLMEEAERDAKRDELYDIWNKRINMYTFPDVIPDPFNLWLKPKMLNKSTTIKAAERDMTAWMEVTQADIDAMQTLGSEYLEAYLAVFDISRAVEIVKQRAEVKERVARMVQDTEDPDEVTATFTIKGKQNIRMVELLLESNEIDFERMY